MDGVEYTLMPMGHQAAPVPKPVLEQGCLKASRSSRILWATGWILVAEFGLNVGRHFIERHVAARAGYVMDVLLTTTWFATCVVTQSLWFLAMRKLSQRQVQAPQGGEISDGLPPLLLQLRERLAQLGTLGTMEPKAFGQLEATLKEINECSTLATTPMRYTKICPSSNVIAIAVTTVCWTVSTVADLVVSAQFWKEHHASPYKGVDWPGLIYNRAILLVPTAIAVLVAWVIRWDIVWKKAQNDFAARYELPKQVPLLTQWLTAAKDPATNATELNRLRGQMSQYFQELVPERVPLARPVEESERQLVPSRASSHTPAS